MEPPNPQAYALGPEDRIQAGERIGSDHEGICCPACSAGYRLPAPLTEAFFLCPCGRRFSLADLRAPESLSPAKGAGDTLLVLSGIHPGPEKEDASPDEQAPAPESPAAEEPLAEASPATETDLSGATRPVAERKKEGAGKTIGGYEILEEIARGGMGVVFRAKQKGLNREVALKMMLAGEGAGEEQIRRFMREAEAAAKLSHPGIVPIYDVGEEGGRHYYTMEFIEGESVAQVIDRMGLIPPRQSLKIGRDVARALHFAHERDILHRDIKPANILLAPTTEGDAPHKRKKSDRLSFSSGTASRFRVLVADFGLAKDMSSGSVLTVSGAALGTPVYMPPEQADGDLDAMGPRSDVYSLGAVLYEMVTGHEPFEGASLGQVLAQVITADPVPPRKRLPGLHRDVETIILAAMAKEPARRYASAQAMAEDIERYLKGEPILARPAGLVYRLSKAMRRNKRLTAAVFLLLAVLAGAVIYNRAEAARVRRETREKVEGLVASGEAFLDDERFGDAERVFTSALTLVPDFGPALAGRRKAQLLRFLAGARELIDEEDYKAAGMLLEEAERLDETHAEVRRLRRLQRGTATLEIAGPHPPDRAAFTALTRVLPLHPDALPPFAEGAEAGLYETLPSPPFGPLDRPFGDGYVVLFEEDRAASCLFASVPRTATVRVVCRVVRVDPGGGGDARTVAEAVEAAEPGAVVEIAGGTYRETVTIETPSLTLRPKPGATVVLEAEKGPVLRAEGVDGPRVRGLTLKAEAGHVLHFLACPGVEVSDNRILGGTKPSVYIKDSPGALVAGNEIAGGKEPGLKFLFNESGAVLGNHIHHTGWTGIAAEGNHLLVARNLVHDNTRGGIFFTHAKHVRVLENVVYNHAEWGIAVADVTRDVRVEGNLVHHTTLPPSKKTNLRTGILCMRTREAEVRHNTVWKNTIGIGSFQSPDAVIFDNLIVESTGVGLHWHEGGDVDYNGLWGNARFINWLDKYADDLEALAGLYAHKGEKMLHGLRADPAFADPAGGDFRLGAESPARGAASDGGDLGADPAVIREVLAGTCDRARWLRGHLARGFAHAARVSEAEGRKEEAARGYRRALLFSPGEAKYEKRLDALEER